jgi:hypothetical protein
MQRSFVGARRRRTIPQCCTLLLRESKRTGGDPNVSQFVDIDYVYMTAPPSDTYMDL